MTNQEKVEEQRQIIKKFMTHFKDHQLDFNDTKLLSEMESEITRVFQLESRDLREIIEVPKSISLEMNLGVVIRILIKN